MDKIIENAKKILEETCKKYKYHNKDIMQGVEGERLHALDVLRWAEKLNPDASIPLKLAALFHDIDRIVTPKMGGGFKGDRKSKAYFLHKKRHAERSAEFIVPILKKNGANSNILKKVKFLITHHDDLGKKIGEINDSDLNYLVASDNFAFFTSIAQKLLKADGAERVKDKIRFMVDKLTDSARLFLWEYRLKNGPFDRLKNEIIKEYYTKNNPREKEYKFCPTCATGLKRKSIDRRKLLSCPKCGFIFWNNPKPVASVIIAKRRKILLIKRAQKPLLGYWCLPGGYIDYDEKPEETAIREIKEETGLNIKIKKLIGVYQIDNDPLGINLDIIYYGQATGEKIKLNKESQEFKFFTINKLPRLIAYKHKEAIGDFKKICLTK
ncbi:MAG: DUF4202 family protein [Patescibacteria group bacterium]|nr:DUF4202 family protein [Patescibacteria group bacterium]MDD5294786.1 DUF4202 family protein [Patescibacteria group bacterium]MDD5554284.1 DUF4202 family protein [Patescibacteria group bacterium]